MKTLKAIFTDRVLRRRIFFVIGMLVLVRFLSTIPIPQIDASHFKQSLAGGNSFFSFLNVFSGGGLSSFSIMMLGVGPYITSSIIMQLLTVLVPRMKEMYQEEGENGRRKFNQYSRLLTLPLSFLQGFALLTLLTRQGTIQAMSMPFMISNLIIITAGSMLLLWIGEQINEKGIGNGVSLIIFAGIIASLPTHISQFFLTFDVSQIPMLIAMIVISMIIIAGIVFVTEAERPIPITYAKQSRLGGDSSGNLGATTYLPIRLNQAGVVPIIFAVSILLLPQFAAQLLAMSSLSSVASFAKKIVDILANQWIYGGLYFFFVVMFTYFYTAITFDPEKAGENLQKNGAFIPGYRPGVATTEYISRVLSRVTLFGALFLGVIAVAPLVVQGVTGVTAIAVGGTSLLIAVSVVLDLIKKIDAQLAMSEY